MAYYDAMIAAWNGVTQPPTGATGTPITGGMTTQQKLTAMNGWTVIGAAIPMIIPTYKIYNVMDTAEFTALSATNQQNIRDILAMGTADLSSGGPARTRMLALFGAGSATRTAMAAMAAAYDTPIIPWWKSVGYPRAFDMGDVAAAGLS